MRKAMAFFLLMKNLSAHGDQITNEYKETPLEIAILREFLF